MHRFFIFTQVCPALDSIVPLSISSEHACTVLYLLWNGLWLPQVRSHLSLAIKQGTLTLVRLEPPSLWHSGPHTWLSAAREGWCWRIAACWQVKHFSLQTCKAGLSICIFIVHLHMSSIHSCPLHWRVRCLYTIARPGTRPCSAKKNSDFQELGGTRVKWRGTRARCTFHAILRVLTEGISLIGLGSRPVANLLIFNSTRDSAMGRALLVL